MKPLLSSFWWVLPVLGGCARTVNYLDPASPRVTGVASVRTAPAAAHGGLSAPGRNLPLPTPPAGPIQRPAQLRIVTFNVELGQAVDSAIALFRQTPELRTADVILLQEMDGEGVARIASALGLSYVYYPAVWHPVTKRDLGNALLSRWPIEDDRKVILPRTSWTRSSRRAAVSATVVVADRRIRVYGVHLATPIEIGFGGQREQLQAVLADADESGLPAVIAGDMNSHTIGREAEAKGFAWPTVAVGPTRGWFDVDHVFVRGLSAPDSGTAGRVLGVRQASDHKPVWALVRLD